VRSASIASLLLALAGCATPAAAPPDFAEAVPSARSCAELGRAIADARAALAAADAKIDRHRTRDQIAGVVSALAIAPLPLAVAHDGASRAAHDARQAEIDSALAARHAQRCADPIPAPSSAAR
jgi:hypothetical protein